MTQSVPDDQVERFYAAAVAGLALLEARAGGGRRFGADADARWRAFRGGLGDWDRLELLVRDAAVRSPAGFAPRVVFDLPGLADDEPCGRDWPGPAPSDAGRLLRAAAEGPGTLEAALASAASAWGLSPRLPAPEVLSSIQPATRLLLAGAGAVVAAALEFSRRPELDLADQSVLLASEPGTRQLFGIALAYLGSARPARVLPLAASAADVRAAGLASVDRALVSDDVVTADATPETDAASLRLRLADLARELGARA